MFSCQRLALMILAGTLPVASQGNLVRIDDSFAYDPVSNLGGIQYSHRDWSPITTNDRLERYNNTYTVSRVHLSQFHFAFRGSSVAYYGDQPPGTISFMVSLDGQPRVNQSWTNTGTATLYKQLLWSSERLDSGDHSLVIGNFDQNNVVGLDYFEVMSWDGSNISAQRTGPGASSVHPQAVVVDNESNSILYPGTEWESYYTNANMTRQSMYFNSTGHCSKTVNSSLSLKFDGTAFWYFGTQYASAAKLKFVVDDKNEQYVDPVGSVDAWYFQQLLWSVTNLPPTSHTVTVTHVGPAGQWACFDFFMYLPSSANPVTSSPTPTSLPDSSSSRSAPVGAIAGGVTGGVVLVVLLVAGVLFYRRRHHRQPAEQSHHETYAGDMAYQNKQADPPYADRPLPPAPALDRMAYSPYVNASTGGKTSISPTVWTGTTYTGHPEPQ